MQPRRKIFVGEPVKQIGEALQLGDDRTAPRLGRMGSQHQLDRKHVQEALHLPGRHPFLLQHANRLGNGFVQRPGIQIPLPFPQLLDTLVLLRQVDQVEVGSERSRDDAGRIDIQRPDLRCQPPGRSCVSRRRSFDAERMRSSVSNNSRELKLADHAA